MSELKYWTSEGFEISSFKHSLNERVNQIYNGSGSDNTNLCKYTYNELGFRGDSIHKKGFRVMSLGCSLTEGVGVNDNETWPAQFCTHINNSVNLNFGTGGRSNDFISRCLISYFDLIKPDLVLIMYTETHRREFFTKEGGVEPYHYKPWGYFSETEDGVVEHEAFMKLHNKENNHQNWYKNHLLIKYFLESKGCNWIWDGWYATKNFSDDNQYISDFYPFMDYGVDNIHPGPKTHEDYAKKLHQFIKDKFPNYLVK